MDSISNRRKMNRIRNKHNKMSIRLEKKLVTLDLKNTDNFKYYINLLNQMYFINQLFDQLEEKINTFNFTLRTNKIKNIRKEIAKDKQIKQDADDKLMQESIDKYKPLIFLHYYLNHRV
jgi:hypothetical protein